MHVNGEYNGERMHLGQASARLGNVTPTASAPDSFALSISAIFLHTVYQVIYLASIHGWTPSARLGTTGAARLVDLP
ncbi:hypothetical protein VTN00DRAFT_4638 [Thermoascus crustaceus]|uniref:uncharacterized protein n=1 Tax=Thermoascus crustaceus TaxID=5088 RepID=UPI0037437E9F